MKKGYVKFLVATFVILGLGMPIKGWLSKGKKPATEQSAQVATRTPLPKFKLQLNGDTSDANLVNMTAEYVGDDIKLSCTRNHGGLVAFHTLRWNPGSTEVVNGQWTRTEYHQKERFLRSPETTVLEFAGKAMVAKLPGTDRWTFLLYEPDINDPKRDVVVSVDEGGGKGSLMPVW